MSSPIDYDTLMCLRSHKGCATKIHTKTDDGWDTRAYRAGYRFDAMESPPMSGIEDLSENISRLEGCEDWMVIRGKLISGAEKEDGVLRRYKHHEDSKPFFAPTDRRWICIDIDGAPAPTVWDVAGSGLKDKVRWAVGAYLPDWMQGVSFHYQWSSSAGIGGWSDLSLHLWFWLDRPVCSQSLREHFRGSEYIDASLFNPVQIHYTAAPIFEGGEDPIAGGRSGLVREEFHSADPPDCILSLDEWREAEKTKERKRQKEKRAAARRSRSRAPAKSGCDRVRYSNRALDSACENIMDAGEGSRHATLVREAAAMGGLVSGGWLDEASTRARLEEAGRVSYASAKRRKDVPRIVDDALKIGMKDPRDLSHVGDISMPFKGSSGGGAKKKTAATNKKKERGSEGDREVEPHRIIGPEIKRWPPMVQRRWHRRVKELEETYQDDRMGDLLAQLVATSELRGDGGTVPPYELDDGDRYHQRDAESKEDVGDAVGKKCLSQ